MSNLPESSSTEAFGFLAWASFIVAMCGSLIGIYFLPVDAWIKGFMGMGYLFTLTSSFTLAKAIRDKHEASRVINRIKDAKTEKLLTEYEKIASNIN